MGLESDHLKAIATAKRSTPEHIAQARLVLGEASTLVQRQDPLQHLYSLPSLWRELWPERAADELRDWAQVLTVQALGTGDANLYLASREAFLNCGAELALLDAPAARRMIGDWPSPGQRFGEEIWDEHKTLMERLASQEFGKRFLEDPRGAVRSLLGKTNPAQATMLRYYEAPKGSAEAETLLDQALVETLDQALMETVSGTSSQTTADNLFRLAWVASRNSPEKLPEIMQHAASVPQSDGMQTAILEAGGQRFMLTYSQSRMLDVLRRMSGHPEAVLATVEAVPWLNDLAVRAGGVDPLLVYGNVTRIPPSEAPDDYHRSRQASRERWQNAREMAKEWKRELSFAPDKVRERIRRLGEQEEGFQLLGNMISSARYNSPRLALMGLEELRRIVLLGEPEELVTRLETLLRVELWVEGAPSQETIDQCLEAAESPDPAVDADARSTQAQQEKATRLRQKAIGAYALLNFPAALQKARAIPEEERLRFLIEIINSLDGE
ncbi:MAG TPA: hypothetical protein VLV83_08415 [Acidobacteriota bacterium]|nr:hypothetical protein [Acidobacteriota bacterium]